jgi:hypothetical protein
MNPFTTDEVLEVASGQKWIMWLVLASLACWLIPYSFLIVAILNLVMVHRLASAMKLSAPLAWALAMIIPLVGILVLLRLSAKATALLKQHGVGVGLMGAHKADLDRLVSASRQAATPGPV